MSVSNVKRLRASNQLIILLLDLHSTNEVGILKILKSEIDRGRNKDT